ncbi:MAG: Ppx/GppA phosphatase family protein [Cohaesibacteraceae bacterium]
MPSTHRCNVDERGSPGGRPVVREVPAVATLDEQRQAAPALHTPTLAKPHHQSSGKRHASDRPAYAALDLGTNNCRLLVAEPTRNGFCVVDSFSRIVRLGAGLSRQCALSNDAMDKAIEALHVCRSKMEGRNVVRSRLIATEACRQASNGEEFIDRVERETGLKLEIADRRTEARLAVSGCATLVEREADGVILFDIGGGSTELAFLDFRSGRPRFHAHMHRFIRAWTSLPVGVVTLAENFGGVHVDRAVFEQMVDQVRAMIERFAAREMMSQCVQGGKVHLLGTSGTVTTLAGVHLGLERYDRRQVDGTWMGSDDVTAMTDRLIGMTFAERVANPCIGADRADLVLAGCAIFEAIRREWPCGRLRVADRGLREGMLVELMAQDGVWRRDRQSGGHRRGRYRGRRGNGPRPASSS